MRFVTKIRIVGIIFLAGVAAAGVSFAQEEQAQVSTAEVPVEATPVVEEPVAVVEPAAPAMTEAVVPVIEEAPVQPEVVVAETPAETPAVPLANPAAMPAGEKVAEWVWGEVVSVDEANKQLVIKHLDYETYEEVQTTLSLGDKTLLENAAGLNEVKPGDYVTVDYTKEGSANIAGLIVVEKKESASAPVQEAVAPPTIAPPAVEPPVVEAPAVEPPVEETPAAVTGQ